VHVLIIVLTQTVAFVCSVSALQCEIDIRKNVT